MKKMSFLVVLMAVAFGLILTSKLTLADITLPDDVNIVAPAPDLAKEIAVFSGKWKGSAYSPKGVAEFFLIFEKIDEEKASLYVYSQRYGWERVDAKVAKEYGKYVIWYGSRPRGVYKVRFIKGDKLELSDLGNTLSVILTRA